MLYGAGFFYVTALGASVLGFGGVAVAAGIVAKVLFFVFLALFLFTLSTEAVKSQTEDYGSSGPYWLAATPGVSIWQAASRLRFWPC